MRDMIHHHDQAVQMAELVKDPPYENAAILQHDPMLAALREDSRFVELLERMRPDTTSVTT